MTNLPRNLRVLSLLCVLNAFLPSAFSQAVAVKSLTIDEIMAGEDFAGTAPSQIRWSGDGRLVYFSWKEVGDKENGTYVVNRDGSGLRRLSEEEAKQQAWPSDGIWDQEQQRFLFVQEGDLFIAAPDGSRRQLTNTQARESDAGFTQDEQEVYFTRENNLYALSLQEGRLVQLTDFRKDSPPSEKKLTASQDFLKLEQEKLFEEFSGDKKAKKDKEEKEQKEKDARAFYIGKEESVDNLTLSPDRQYVTFHLIKRADKAIRTIVPEYVTLDGYSRDIPSRTKVGDEQETRKLGIYRIESGEVNWVENTEDLAVLRGPLFSQDGSSAAFLTVSKDFKDRKILTLNLEDGSTSTLDELRNEAWIGGPEAYSFGWVPDHKTVYFVSEADGWAHLYLAGRDGASRRQLTSGEWEVTSVDLSRDRTHWVLTTSEVDRGERHAYTMALDGGPRTRLTHEEGNNQVVLSPDEQVLAFVHSSANTPPELYLKTNEAGSKAIRITSSPSPEFEAYRWSIPEFVRIEARDGAGIPGRFYRPSQPAPGRPAVVFVHGAGYLQNAHKWWSSYYREYMFHHFLMEQGYHVLDIDYRGSAGYGRQWRTGIYRHMGGKDLTDQVDAAVWLVEKQEVDPARIGIYGGSYGGFITLMAMFTEPHAFAAGASLRPVTDWSHYNHGYTGRILNLPQDDPEAYSQSSPIYFAEGLKGALLICHGMVDTNVHFQDTVRLIQRLIELRKENWEVAIYPVEGHGFQNATSWADEYKRIFRLFEENLKGERLQGGVTSGN